MFGDSSERIKAYFATNGLNLGKACVKAAEKAARIIDQREYESIHICMREYPTETMRPRTFNGHTFSPNAAANKRYFEKALKRVTDELRLIYTPGEIQVDAFLEMPSQVPPDEVILYEAQLLHPESYPDGDNVLKAYLDMMTDVLTVDDNLFWHMDVRKWYSLEPRVELHITYETRIESDYLYRRLKGRKSIKEAIQAGQLELLRL